MKYSLLLFLLLGCSHSTHKHHRFSNAKKWSKKFDSPTRKNWQKPQEVVELMNIRPNDKIADIGAGTGFMLPYLNELISEKGHVYAMDVEPNLIDFMKRRIHKEKLINTTAHLIVKNAPALKAKKVNKVLFVNTWHHIPHHKRYVKHLYNELPKPSSLFFVEQEPGKGGPGPKHRIAPNQIMELFQVNGFKCQQEKESLPYQYIVRCEKS